MLTIGFSATTNKYHYLSDNEIHILIIVSKNTKTNHQLQTLFKQMPNMERSNLILPSGKTKTRHFSSILFLLQTNNVYSTDLHRLKRYEAYQGNCGVGNEEEKTYYTNIKQGMTRIQFLWSPTPYCLLREGGVIPRFHESWQSVKQGLQL